MHKSYIAFDWIRANRHAVVVEPPAPSLQSPAQTLENSIFSVILLGELDQRRFCSIFSEDLFCSNVLLRLSNFSSSSQSSRSLPPFSSLYLHKLRLRPKRPPL